MDRRVFQPEAGGGRVHRRNALVLSGAVLLSGALVLVYLHGGLRQWWGAAAFGALLTVYLYARLRLGRAKPASAEKPAARPRRRSRFPALPPDTNP